MFALIKYNFDSIDIVPVNYIKDFDDKKHEINDSCHAFWSPNEEDTPENVLKTKGKILVLPENRRSSLPLAGYHAATILMLGNSEAELEAFCEDKEGRENMKQISSKINKVSKKDGGKTTNSKFSYYKFRKLGSKASINYLEESLFDDYKETNKCKKKEENDSIRYWKRKYQSTLLKLQESEKRYNELSTVNVKLQKIYFDLLQRTAQKLPITTETPLATPTPPETCITLKEVPLNSSNVHNTSDLSTPSMHNTPTVNTTTPETCTVLKEVPLNSSNVHNTSDLPTTIQNTPAVYTVPKKPVSTPEVVLAQSTPTSVEPAINPDLTHDAPPDVTPQKEDDCDISDEVYQKFLCSVKKGEYGDSLFVKKLAVSIFTSDVLKECSVSGQRCYSKKDSQARPPLCHKKMDVLMRAFKKRVRDEGVSDEEVHKRAKKVNSFIAEKIATLNRAHK